MLKNIRENLNEILLNSFLGKKLHNVPESINKKQTTVRHKQVPTALAILKMKSKPKKKGPISMEEQVNRAKMGIKLKEQGIISEFKGSVNKQKKIKLWETREHSCAYCKKELDFLTATVDHYVPKSKGGTLALDNLMLSCNPCNVLKADKVLSDMQIPVVEKKDKNIVPAITQVYPLTEKEREKRKFFSKKQRRIAETVENLVSLKLNKEDRYTDKQLLKLKELTILLYNDTLELTAGRVILEDSDKYHK